MKEDILMFKETLQPQFLG